MVPPCAALAEAPAATVGRKRAGERLMRPRSTIAACSLFISGVGALSASAPEIGFGVLTIRGGATTGGETTGGVAGDRGSPPWPVVPVPPAEVLTGGGTTNEPEGSCGWVCVGVG